MTVLPLFSGLFALWQPWPILCKLHKKRGFWPFDNGMTVGYNAIVGRANSPPGTLKTEQAEGNPKRGKPPRIASNENGAPTLRNDSAQDTQREGTENVRAGR